ncbi:unnamed protein product [Linum trigynum]|uniref:MULE transposase domain-containing protein n=1 Tax=Linum trigynum TaxID=586398 RepID=A0AAV2FSS9_9ROSI
MNCKQRSMQFLRSNKSVSEDEVLMVEANADAGVSLTSSYKLLAMCSAGYENLSFSKNDLKNHLNKRRQKNIAHGEATFLLEYFHKQMETKHGFYYSVEVDCEEQVANIFWSNAQMRADYKLFGNSVSFDTTYRTNKSYRPLGMFVGFNHHRQTCIFGACLLYDETSASFEWLFDAFRRCMDHKLPTTIFTDQDAAMAKALRNEWPGVFHALCTWKILMCYWVRQMILYAAPKWPSQCSMYRQANTP